MESIPAVIDLVRQGFGFAVLPRNAVTSTRWADEVQVRPIVAPVLMTSLSIATSTQRPTGPLMRRALEVIREVVRQEIQATENA